MITAYNNKSLLFGVPGIVLQIGGNIVMRTTTEASIVALSWLAMLVGTVLLLVGFAYYAKAKGHHPAWCLVAFLSCIGLIILACLKDRTAKDQKGGA